MKRYNMDHIDGLFEEPEGEWVKHSDHETEINKLKKQNKEMLEKLKTIIEKWNRTEDQACLDKNPMDALLMMSIIDAENLIEKIEQEKDK